MLRRDAIHPLLEPQVDKLRTIVETSPGMFADFPLLHLYLGIQIEVLKLNDSMFAHDFTPTASNRLMEYAKGEMRELAEVIPIFAKEAPTPVDGIASYEGGDVAWFLAMRVALGHLYPVEHSLQNEERAEVLCMLNVLHALQGGYPDFDPAKHAVSVQKKVEDNYPHRVLRASPHMTLEQMSNEFESLRYPDLRGLRKKLPGEIIPHRVSVALLQGNPVMPSVEGAEAGVDERYEAVLAHALSASQYYAY